MRPQVSRRVRPPSRRSQRAVGSSGGPDAAAEGQSPVIARTAARYYGSAPAGRPTIRWCRRPRRRRRHRRSPCRAVRVRRVPRSPTPPAPRTARRQGVGGEVTAVQRQHAPKTVSASLTWSSVSASRFSRGLHPGAGKQVRQVQRMGARKVPWCQPTPGPELPVSCSGPPLSPVPPSGATLAERAGRDRDEDDVGDVGPWRSGGRERSGLQGLVRRLVGCGARWVCRSRASRRGRRPRGAGGSLSALWRLPWAVRGRSRQAWSSSAKRGRPCWVVER